MESITYHSPLCSTHPFYDIQRLRLLALLFASFRFANSKMTGVTFTFIFTFSTRPCNGCDLPANRTDITTMTSFGYDGVHYISESKGLYFLHRYDDDDGHRLCSRWERYWNMFMMRLMMQFFFHRPKNGEVRLLAFMRRDIYLLFLEGMLAGKMWEGMDANNYVLFVHTPYHVS